MLDVTVKRTFVEFGRDVNCFYLVSVENVPQSLKSKIPVTDFISTSSGGWIRKFCMFLKRNNRKLVEFLGSS